MKVIGYLRVSTDEQARSGLGMDAQRATLQAFANAAGHDVEWVADEGESGKNGNRPGLQMALGMLRKGEADALAVAKLDRLSRSVHDFSGMLRTAQAEKWRIVALDMGIDTSNMTGRLVAHILMAVSEWEREAIGQRTSDAIQVRLARGEEWGRRSLMESATEALIREMRDDGLSGHAIARILNEQAVPTARGGTWHPSTVIRVLKRIDRIQKANAA